MTRATSIHQAVLFVGIVIALGACSSKNSSYSALGSSQEFSQSVQNNEVDVLWVIDNSGSMANSQQNLANNFPSFINNFQSSGFDFKIAVTTSDAYMAGPQWTPYYNQSPKPAVFRGGTQEEMAKFRDGLGTNHSGFFVIDPLTPDIDNVFITNVLQGISGSGDERVIQSMKAALNSSLNPNFIRPGAFLAVVLVTDEDDFSHDGTANLENQYSNAALHPAQNYVDYLDSITSSSGASRRYTVNSVSIKDADCLAQIGGPGTGKKIAQRVHELVDATGGTKANICGNFAIELGDLADNIISLATQFYLDAEPIPSTIRVFVNGSQLPAEAWTYNAEANSVVFASGYTPGSGAKIHVSFDPVGIIF